MEKVDTLVVDKTGTLTEGRPSVDRFVTTNGFQEDDLLRLVAAVERASEHPPQAIVNAATQPKPDHPDVTAGDFDAPVGKGVIGTVERRRQVWPAAHPSPTKGIDPTPRTTRPTSCVPTVPR